MLSSLNRDGLIRYDSETNNWRWDIGEINAEAIADNVADFLAKTINQLPEETRNTLSLAACMGNRSDLSTLALISGQNMSEVIKLLSIPLSELYVLESGDSYEFVHDQVQQAAYGLLDAQDRKSKHLEIGRLLLKGTDELVTAAVAADAAKDVAAAGVAEIAEGAADLDAAATLDEAAEAVQDD